MARQFARMAKRDKKAGGRAGTTIIRREEPAPSGHHGGAWKVAYADFVTAMMAFFLVMWLLNATTEEQRKGLADYFSPTNLLSHNSSGTGQPFGGHTAFDKGAMVSDRGAVRVTQGTRPILGEGQRADATFPNPSRKPPLNPRRHPADVPPTPAERPAPQRIPAATTQTTPSAAPRTLQASAVHAVPAALSSTDSGAAREGHALAAAKRAIESLVRRDKELAGLARHLAIDITPQGLRIQILDSARQAMFATGSTRPSPRTKLLLDRIAPILARLPEQISIAGYTDAAPYPGPRMTNWELSAGRANAARRELVAAGVPDARIRDVTGHADHDLLLPADPLAPANRRVAILVLRGTGRAAARTPLHRP